MNVFDKNFEQDLRRVIREEVRPIVQEETQSMRDDITTIKTVLGSHDLRLKAITSELGSVKAILRTHSLELSGLKTTMQAQVGEVKSLGVLLEDLEYRFAAAHE